jgi:signal transduction histidine kinase
LATALRPTLLTTAALAVVLTVAVSVANVNLAWRAPEGHVAIETAAALISLLVAFIVTGRFLQGHRLTDLYLGAALTVLGLTNLLFAVVPAAAAGGFTRWATWASVAGRIAGAAGIAAAAVVRARDVRRPRRALTLAAAATLALLALVAAAVAVLGARLPLGIDPALSPTGGTGPRIVGNAAVLGIQLAAFVLYSAASLGFMLRAERTRDGLLGWFAIAASLHAFAALNYFLFPSLYSTWVYTGDFLRLGFFLVLLLGAAAEIQRYQRSLASTAALEERRRLARELHDGLAQELAFIATQSRWLSRDAPDGSQAEQLVVAAERALDESRSAISALTRPLDESLDAAIAQAAEDVAGRVGVRIKLNLDEGVEVPAGARAALVRIVREAVSNTARHGQAETVKVELSGGTVVRLAIEDDGVGFDTEERHERGFGLTSMRERATGVGAQLNVSSQPGAGTRIEVVLP